MCIFQSGKDIPPLVRLSLRTLQYLVIPLLSFSLIFVGVLHWGQCDAEPKLPLWHIVSGASGLLTPVLYLLFDEINPWLTRHRHGVLSEILDNFVLCLLPLYLLFEVFWLITGSIWVFGTSNISSPNQCDHSIYVFSIVVILNFWIHVLTPLFFMVSLCMSRIFPSIGTFPIWKSIKIYNQSWTQKKRLFTASILALPLGVSMIGVGIAALSHYCVSDTSAKIPIWLLIAGLTLLFVPSIYLLYDKFCKNERTNDGSNNDSENETFFVQTSVKSLVIVYLLGGLSWSIVGFLWVFGAHQNEICGAESKTYQFAFGSLILLNIFMDVWIVFKICIVLYWAFLSDD